MRTISHSPSFSFSQRPQNLGCIHSLTNLEPRWSSEARRNTFTRMRTQCLTACTDCVPSMVFKIPFCPCEHRSIVQSMHTIGYYTVSKSSREVPTTHTSISVLLILAAGLHDARRCTVIHIAWPIISNACVRMVARLCRYIIVLRQAGDHN